VRAFEFFKGVAQRVLYDNTSIAVSMVVQGRDRSLTRGFLQLKSHYLFDHQFCHVRRANEKGVVEGGVRYVRSNFLVPVPQVESFHSAQRISAGLLPQRLEMKTPGTECLQGRVA